MGIGRRDVGEKLAEDVASVVDEILSGHESRRWREICAPLWLIDLGLRLCIGERVVFAEPGHLWRPTVEMLARWEVQAIVVVPAGELAAAA
jgi:hypothetical protein